MGDFKFWVVGKVNKTKNLARYSEIAGMWKAGLVTEEIAKRYGVSRQRIQQILKKQGLEREDGGQAIQRFKRAHDIVNYRKEKAAARDAACRAKWGISLEDYLHQVRQYGNTAVKDSPLRRFQNQRKTAIYTRHIEWKLTFAEWWQIWQDSGKWEQRGRGKGYGMSRYGDSGPYAVGNVYICTSGQNFSDSYLVHSAKSRTRKRGMGKKGYWLNAGKYHVYVGKDYVGRFKTIEEARRAYETKWAEKYGSKEPS